MIARTRTPPRSPHRRADAPTQLLTRGVHGEASHGRGAARERWRLADVRRRRPSACQTNDNTELWRSRRWRGQAGQWVGRVEQGRGERRTSVVLNTAVGFGILLSVRERR